MVYITTADTTTVNVECFFLHSIRPKVIFFLQTASTGMDVVTVATEASQFQGTLVSRGMRNALTNTISMKRFTKS